MSIRKTNFVIGEYYHVYNRGADKRDIFCDQEDLNRFFQSIQDFNTEDPIGSLYEKNYLSKKLNFGGKAAKKSENKKLVSIIAYCLNPNHFHFILTPLVENGIQKFMQRLGGYSTYFNLKNGRSGSLFQGKFKSKHIDSNEYLIHLSIYINCNNYDSNCSIQSKLSRSSFLEYISPQDVKNIICDTNIILKQLKSNKEYQKIAKGTWKEISRKKDQLKVFEFLGARPPKKRIK